MVSESGEQRPRREEQIGSCGSAMDNERLAMETLEVGYRIGDSDASSILRKPFAQLAQIFGWEKARSVCDRHPSVMNLFALVDLALEESEENQMRNELKAATKNDEPFEHGLTENLKTNEIPNEALLNIVQEVQTDNADVNGDYSHRFVADVGLVNSHLLERRTTPQSELVISTDNQENSGRKVVSLSVDDLMMDYVMDQSSALTFRNNQTSKNVNKQSNDDLIDFSDSGRNDLKLRQFGEADCFFLEDVTKKEKIQDLPETKDSAHSGIDRTLDLIQF
ncbi:hypothetical protein AB6A40_006652 [Gnathostoma spinigerum]|uniref:Uncharacterized protein n=1 Tax=Gnathostoma spinigerum TaxID=75299 RepID=A0ABD6EIY7_9BILA